MATIKLVIKWILYQPLFNALIFLVWLIPGHNVAWAIIILTVSTLSTCGQSVENL